MKDLDYEINKICQFIKDSVLKTKSNGVIIALSGGLDSAVVAALSTKAIGKENVHCYFPRYNFGSVDIDKLLTDTFCNKFGLTYEENRIASQSSKASFFYRMVRNATNIINTFIYNNEYLLLVFGNIDATMRAGFLNRKAKEHNCLMLGTTNRSELSIGFFTKFDKCGCDLQPILHLYKTEIVELAKYLDIPEEIVNRIPSADFWYRQTNEGGLTFQKLDKILIELGRIDIDSTELKINCATEEEVAKCISMVKKAKQKHNGGFPPCLNC